MQATAYRFGEFELHPARFELSRNGEKVRIERIPLELLILLLEKDGQLVTRQEIVERLWGKDVFLDTEHGINTAIRKIRAALEDDRDAPKYIQTVSGKGYRFLTSTLEQLGPPIAAATPEIIPERAMPPQIAPVTAARTSTSKHAKLIVGSVLLLAIAGLLFAFRGSFFRSKEVGPIHSIAVLPLTNLSGDASQEYLADGLTDEITTMLAKQTTLRVVSRTSAMQFKDAKRPLHSVAHDLSVDGILEGSVSRVNSRVHVTVQLIYGPTDTHVWAESYDRDLAQTFELPSEISLTIAHNLNTAASVAQQKHVSAEAHDAYLHARYLWFRSDFDRSREFYEKAIQIQPDYAAAWAGLSGTFSASAANEVHPVKELAGPAEATARKALELDDTLAEAHHALAANHLFFAWDPVRADAESRRAIELDPNIAEQYFLHALILFAMNRVDEALAEEKHAMEIAPFERTWGLGLSYLQARRFDDATAELRMRAESAPTDSSVRFVLSEVYFYRHMPEDAQREFEQVLRLEHPDQVEAVHRAYLQGGEPAVQRWKLAQAIKESSKEYRSAHFLAERYAFAGDRENTLKYLEAGYRDHDAWMILVQTQPQFDFIHQEPRYQAIVRGMGLQLASNSK